MAKHQVQIQLDEIGRGTVLLDGSPVNVDSIRIRAGVGQLTKVEVRLVDVALRYDGPAETVANITTTENDSRRWRAL